jgi:Cu/Ag efflux pump CusA
VRTIGLTSKTRSLADLDIAQWTVKPQLLGTSGVADVIVFGGETRQMQIQVDPAKLIGHGLSIQEVIAAARQATGVHGAGFIENSNQRIAINADGQIATPQKLASVVLRSSNGGAVRLGDIANVTWGDAPAVGAASIMGKPGVMVVMEAQYGTNTMAVTRAIERTLAGLEPALARQGVDGEHQRLPACQLHRGRRRSPAHDTHRRRRAGHRRAVPVLLNVRTAVISAVAIPLSLLVAIIVLTSFGVSLNTMTLGGPRHRTGRGGRRCHHRRREHLPAPARELHPGPAASSVSHRAASLEVRSAVVFATFIVMLIFLPVLTLTGIGGRLFAPLGIAYILAVLASLGVALTLTPAMALALLAKGPLPEREPRLIGRLKTRYIAMLTKVEQHVKVIMVIVAVLCAAALASLPFMSGSFIPQLREGHYTVHMGLAPGTSLAESIRIGTQVSNALMQVPGVRLVAQRAGRANGVVDPTGVQLSEFEVDLKPMGASGQELGALPDPPGAVTLSGPIHLGQHLS